MNMKLNCSTEKLKSFIISIKKNNDPFSIHYASEDSLENRIVVLCKNMIEDSISLTSYANEDNNKSYIEFKTRNEKKYVFLTAIFKALDKLPDNLGNLDDILFSNQELSDLITACNYLERDRAKSQGGRYFNEFIHIIRYTFTALKGYKELRTKNKNLPDLEKNDKLSKITQKLEENINKHNGSTFGKTAHMSFRAISIGSISGIVASGSLFSAGCLSVGISGVCAFCKAVVVGLAGGMALGTCGIAAAVVVGCGLLGFSAYHVIKISQEHKAEKRLSNKLEQNVNSLLNDTHITSEYNKYYSIKASEFYMNYSSKKYGKNEELHNDQAWSRQYAGQSLYTINGGFDTRFLTRIEQIKLTEDEFLELNDAQKIQFFQLYGIMSGAKSLLMLDKTSREKMEQFTDTEYFDFGISFFLKYKKKFETLAINRLIEIREFCHTLLRNRTYSIESIYNCGISNPTDDIKNNLNSVLEARIKSLDSFISMQSYLKNHPIDNQVKNLIKKLAQLLFMTNP